jgi:hypothetical protein
MSCLEATFTLTPQSASYYNSPGNAAALFCYGADFWSVLAEDFSELYSSNRFFFDGSFAADPNLDYTQWANRKKAQQLQVYIDLSDYAAANKQLALIFGFDVLYQAYPGRVLVYTDARLLKDQQLVYGDNQFLLEIESLNQPFNLYFIHAANEWFFRGLSGYVV